MHCVCAVLLFVFLLSEESICILKSDVRMYFLLAVRTLVMFLIHRQFVTLRVVYPLCLCVPLSCPVQLKYVLLNIGYTGLKEMNLKNSNKVSIIHLFHRGILLSRNLLKLMRFGARLSILYSIYGSPKKSTFLSIRLFLHQMCCLYTCCFIIMLMFAFAGHS
jgi:hypothetical protein